MLHQARSAGLLIALQLRQNSSKVRLSGAALVDRLLELILLSLEAFDLVFKHLTLLTDQSGKIFSSLVLGLRFSDFLVRCDLRNCRSNRSYLLELLDLSHEISALLCLPAAVESFVQGE